MFQQVLAAQRFLGSSVSLAQAQEVWKKATLDEVVAALGDPRISVHPLSDFHIRLLQIEDVGLVVLSRPGSGMGNFRFKLDLGESIQSEEFSLVCGCCSLYTRNDRYNDREDAGQMARELRQAIVEVKLASGVSRIMFQLPGGCFGAHTEQQWPKPDWLKNFGEPLPELPPSPILLKGRDYVE